MPDLSYGQPQLSEYEPWIKIPRSKGLNSTVSRINGNKTNRVHHLLSRNETRYFYYLEWASNVTDIREQFPLNIDQTREIAKSSGMGHAKFAGKEIVMTTDFLISIDNHHVIARTFKMSKELNKKRVLEKFAIEREYWGKLGVDWGIVTEKEIDNEIVANIEFYHHSRSYLEDENIPEEYIKAVIGGVNSAEDSLRNILSDIDKYYNLEFGQALSIFKSLVFKKRIKVNMRKKFNISMQCRDIKVM
jgi:hypothetical protein